MKRRDFIKTSLLTIGGSALLTTGCGKKEIIKNEGQIAKRKFKDKLIPLLGFGCMRLPMNGSEVDMSEFEKMTDYAMSHGANYFDTAYRYVDGKSEIATGKILKNYKREDFILADKSPIRGMKSVDDIHRIFNEQLKKCQVDYFDFYMIHNINVFTFETYRKLNVFDELLKYKKDGRIKYLGFSFHGDSKMLKEVAPEHPWDFAQLQINYLDWDVINAHEQYNIVQSQGIPVTVMEPLRGGGLVNLNEKALTKLKELYPNTTPAEFGLRWAASQNNVITVLSGMSNFQQMKENIKTFMNYSDMTEDELKAADTIARIIQSQGEINCTACKYCMEVCPRGINIPAIFSLYNQYKDTKDLSLFRMYMNSLNESERPDKCIKCNLCNSNCPQSLDIPTLLAKIDELNKNMKMG